MLGAGGRHRVAGRSKVRRPAGPLGTRFESGGTRIITGEHTCVDLKNGQALAESPPIGKLVIFPGGGHTEPMTRLISINRLLAGFLQDKADIRQWLREHGSTLLIFILFIVGLGKDLLDRLEAISDRWLVLKGVREKSFSLGRFEHGYLNAFPLALVYQNGELSAFANILVTGTRAMATTDLMRHLPEADNSTMDFLFIELMLALKADGYSWFSLGMAPLSGMMDHRQAPFWDRFGLLIYKSGGRFYNFEGLRNFKKKFDPVWQPRYLATSRRGINPYVTLADIGVLTSGGIKAMFSH